MRTSFDTEMNPSAETDEIENYHLFGPLQQRADYVSAAIAVVKKNDAGIQVT